MHFLQVLVVGWFSFGVATVAVMFWLCKRTAAATDLVKAGSLSPQRAEFGASELSGELRSA